MGLDYRRLPIQCDPDYRHTVPTGQDAHAIQHAARMKAIMSGEAPLQLHSSQPQTAPAQPTASIQGPRRQCLQPSLQLQQLLPGQAMHHQASLRV